MSLHSLFWIVVALALSLAPVGVQNGAMAMSPATDQHAQNMQGGHCDNEVPKHHDGKSANNACCVAMCTAIVGIVNSEMALFGSVRSTGPALPSPFLHEFLAKLPTPPPRAA